MVLWFPFFMVYVFLRFFTFYVTDFTLPTLRYRHLKGVGNVFTTFLRLRFYVYVFTFAFLRLRFYVYVFTFTFLRFYVTDTFKVSVTFYDVLRRFTTFLRRFYDEYITV
ncbi:MAG: hypothetical protein RI894_1158 [Bacteroidota bacterium]